MAEGAEETAGDTGPADAGPAGAEDGAATKKGFTLSVDAAPFVPGASRAGGGTSAAPNFAAALLKAPGKPKAPASGAGAEPSGAASGSKAAPDASTGKPKAGAGAAAKAGGKAGAASGGKQGGTAANGGAAATAAAATPAAPSKPNFAQMVAREKPQQQQQQQAPVSTPAQSPGTPPRPTAPKPARAAAPPAAAPQAASAAVPAAETKPVEAATAQQQPQKQQASPPLPAKEDSAGEEPKEAQAAPKAAPPAAAAAQPKGSWAAKLRPLAEPEGAAAPPPQAQAARARAGRTAPPPAAAPAAPAAAEIPREGAEALAEMLSVEGYDVDAEYHDGYEPRGLLNTGQSCYLNATLQALLACIEFRKFLRRLHGARGALPATGADTLHALAALAAETVVPDRKGGRGRGAPPLAPAMLEPVLAAFGGQVQRQEDAPEFLQFLLDRAHEECARLGAAAGAAARAGAATAAAEANGNGRADANGAPAANGGAAKDANEEDEWEEVMVGRKNKSAVTHKAAVQNVAGSPVAALFGGTLRSTLKVARAKPSATLQPFHMIALDVEAEGVRSVEDALSRFAAPENLDDFRVKDAPSAATKTVQLASAPQLLVLQLKRFAVDPESGVASKVAKPVRFSTALTLRRNVLASTEGTVRYDLVATVSHQGETLERGHYTADVRRSRGGWLRINDSEVAPVASRDAFHEQAYLLLYRRAPPEQA